MFGQLEPEREREKQVFDLLGQRAVRKEDRNAWPMHCKCTVSLYIINTVQKKDFASAVRLY